MEVTKKDLFIFIAQTYSFRCRRPKNDFVSVEIGDMLATNLPFHLQ